MPKLVHRLPVAHLHKPSGRARVRIGGRDYWLGRHGSPEAQAAYDRLIAEYLLNGKHAPSTAPAAEPAVVQPAAAEVTVSVLCAEFWAWANLHYRAADGSPTREADNFRTVIRRLRRTFGSLAVDHFGPVKLLEFRALLIRRKLARRTINQMIRRVRQIFRWGISRELVPVEVLARLETVEPLQPNRGGRETSGSRGSVAWEVVEATLPALPELIQAFVVVAFHSGARRGELARLTTGMIDRTGEVWSADLADHKTAHHEKKRVLYFGPRARSALEPWILPANPDYPIFSPRRVDDRQRKRRGKRLPGLYYSRSGLDQALRRALDRTGGERWTLGQLRHSAAVRITDALDLEAARQTLGHSSQATTRHYAAEAEAAATEAARLTG